MVRAQSAGVYSYLSTVAISTDFAAALRMIVAGNWILTPARGLHFFPFSKRDCVRSFGTVYA